VEHVWEENVYNTSGKMQRRNFVCEPNKEKHVSLASSLAARVDQKGNCGNDPENYAL